MVSDNRGGTRKAEPKGLGDGEYTSATDWIKKSRALAAAPKKKVVAVDYDEQDANLEEQDAVASNLRVLHDQEAFQEGTEHILTLKDVSVLDEKGDGLNEEVDALENAAFLESEKRKFKEKSKKSAYNVYDDLEGKLSSILPQYDDDNMEFKQKGFDLNEEGDAMPNYGGQAQGTQLDSIRAKLQESLGFVKAEVKTEGSRTQYSLDPAEFGIKVQSDYQAPSEVKFKKLKRVEKKSTRKSKSSSLISHLESQVADEESENHGSRGQSVKVERDALKAILALESKEKAYEVAKRKAEESRAAVSQLASSAMVEEPEEKTRIENEDEDGAIVFDPTEEFAKNVASTEDDLFGRQRRRQEIAVQQKVKDKADAEKSGGGGGGWTETSLEEEQNQDDDDDGDTAQESYRRNLEGVQAFAEPKAGGSLADALALISQKGWITEEFSGRQNDRVVDLRENDPAPQINIERKDETGREMTQKEAFRRLSHKFHGKAPGKLKQEKKIKRFKEERTLTGMDATDTPLNSVKALQHAQQVTQSAFIVVQGGGSDHMGLAPLLSKKDKRRGEDAGGGSESTVNKRMRTN